MAWFRNEYECYECGEKWDDEWSCIVDDECPSCEARDASPIESTDLTFVIEQEVDCFVVLRSSDDAEYSPDYREAFRTLRKDFAEMYVRAGQVRCGQPTIA